MEQRNPLDDLPRVDPRWRVTQLAEGEIGLAISELAAKHGLSYAELIEILANNIRRWAQRQERHDRGAEHT